MIRSSGHNHHRFAACVDIMGSNMPGFYSLRQTSGADAFGGLGDGPAKPSGSGRVRTSEGFRDLRAVSPDRRSSRRVTPPAGGSITYYAAALMAPSRWQGPPYNVSTGLPSSPYSCHHPQRSPQRPVDFHSLYYCFTRTLNLVSPPLNSLGNVPC